MKMKNSTVSQLCPVAMVIEFIALCSSFAATVINNTRPSKLSQFFATPNSYKNNSATEALIYLVFGNIAAHNTAANLQ